MAEELRFFLRAGLYAAALAVIYWFVSYDIPGTVLLLLLGVSIAALVLLLASHEPATVDELGEEGGGPRAWLNRFVGFHEPTDRPAPLAGGPEVVPLGSVWPILTAAALVLMGLGLVFGPWIAVPGAALLVLAGIGWATQLDRR